MADIAKKAGVAAGTIYRYFESKDVLITELYRELAERIKIVLLEGYLSARPLRERFIYVFEKIIRYFMTHPLHFRYLEQYFNSPYGISLRRDRLLSKSGGNDILRDIFEQGVEQEVLKGLPAVVLNSLAFGPLSSLIREHTLGFVNLDDALIKQTAEACWDAIKSDAGV